MSANEAYELAVRLRGEGIEQTKQDLDGVEDSFDETASSVENSAENMQVFGQIWQGALQAATVGLAVAAAGLLNQIPIVSELFAGLFAIVESVAFQIDSVLRPVLSPLTSKFFDISTAIFEADGALGTFIGVLGTAITVIGTVVGILAAISIAAGPVAGALGTLAGTFTTIISVIGTVISVIGLIITTIGLLPIAIVAAVVLALAGIWMFRDQIAAALSSAIDWLLSLVDSAAKMASGVVSWFETLAADAWTWIKTLAGNVRDTFSDLVSDAIDFGKDLVQGFIDGIRSLISNVRTAASDVAAAARSYLPGSPAERGPLSDLDATGPGLVETFSAGIRQNIPQAERATEGLADGARPDPSFAAGRSNDQDIYLDGRKINDNQGRFRASDIDLRGR